MIYKEFIKTIHSPSELMDWMNANITYELPLEDYDEGDTIPTKSGEELWQTRCGHCGEQSYFERDVFKSLGYKCYLIHCKEENADESYDVEGSAHMFVIYKDNNKYIYFEHAMEHARGQYTFDSVGEVFDYVAKVWWRYDKESTNLVFRQITRPIVGVNALKLTEECYNAPVIAKRDISNNRIK